jgi:hypothetical protein
MNGKRAHKTRRNLRLEYIYKFDRWLEAEPPMILFWRWHSWKNRRPVWREIWKGGKYHD